MQEGRQLGASAKHFGCKGCGSLTWLFFWANGESTKNSEQESMFCQSCQQSSVLSPEVTQGSLNATLFWRDESNLTW